jgi:hypothetical protein
MDSPPASVLELVHSLPNLLIIDFDSNDTTQFERHPSWANQSWKLAQFSFYGWIAVGATLAAFTAVFACLRFVVDPRGSKTPVDGSKRRRSSTGFAGEGVRPFGTAGRRSTYRRRFHRCWFVNGVLFTDCSVELHVARYVDSSSNVGARCSLLLLTLCHPKNCKQHYSVERVEPEMIRSILGSAG